MAVETHKDIKMIRMIPTIKHRGEKGQPIPKIVTFFELNEEQAQHLDFFDDWGEISMIKHESSVNDKDPIVAIGFSAKDTLKGRGKKRYLQAEGLIRLSELEEMIKRFKKS